MVYVETRGILLRATDEIVSFRLGQSESLRFAILLVASRKILR